MPPHLIQTLSAYLHMGILREGMLLLEKEEGMELEKLEKDEEE